MAEFLKFNLFDIPVINFDTAGIYLDDTISMIKQKILLVNLKLHTLI